MNNWKKYRYTNKKGSVDLPAIQFDGTKEMAQELKRLIQPDYTCEICILRYEEHLHLGNEWRYYLMFPLARVRRGDWVIHGDNHYWFQHEDYFNKHFKEIEND